MPHPYTGWVTRLRCSKVTETQSKQQPLSPPFYTLTFSCGHLDWPRSCKTSALSSHVIF